MSTENAVAGDSAGSLEPIEGDVGIPSVAQARTRSVSWKGIFAVAMFVVSLAVAAVFSINRALVNHSKDDDPAAKATGERPIAATAEPRRLDMTPPPAPSKAASSAPPYRAIAIPAIVPTPDDAMQEPIGVHRTGQGPARVADGQHVSPEDAPVVLVSSRPGAIATSQGTASRAAQSTARADASAADDSLEATKRNLEGYQRQLQTLLDTLPQASAGLGPALSPGATPMGGAHLPSAPAAPGAGAGAGLFGGQLQGSATPRVVAGLMPNRSLRLPKGTAFTCALKTKVVSAASGFVSCQVQRNVFSEDGRVLLIERGSHMDGEYRIASVRPGTVRIPVLWTRIRTPHGVTVDIDSPGTGALGESGIDGYVDNRWGERIGAAMLLSLIDDSVKLVIQNQANDRQGDTIVLPSTAANTSKLAEKVLDSTINIPPLIYQNQGSIVGIYVARDVDFASVYELKAAPR